MDNRIQYHKTIFEDLSGSCSNIKFDSDYRSSDGLILNATEVYTDSKIGIIIIPGIWYPREAYYNLLISMSKNFNVMVYDQRGHSYSQGQFNIDLMVDDLITVAEQYCNNTGIDHLYLVGHSLGGYVSAIATSKNQSRYFKGQVLLAPPVSLKSSMKNIPSKITLPKIYLMNLFRAMTPKYRGNIVKEYVSFNYRQFKKKPYFFALKSDNPDQIISNLKASDDISCAISNQHLKTLYLWGDNDKTLGIKKTYPLKYKNFINEYIEPSSLIQELLLQGMSHQFNFDDKEIIFIAGDNKVVQDIIFEFIGKG